MGYQWVSSLNMVVKGITGVTAAYFQAIRPACMGAVSSSGSVYSRLGRKLHCSGCRFQLCLMLRRVGESLEQHDKRKSIIIKKFSGFNFSLRIEFMDELCSR